MDMKLSIFGKGANRKTRYEVYVALENALGMLSIIQGNDSFDPYTGEVYKGMDVDITTGTIGIPVPIPSFGFKYSY
jgi:hypothetical protein